MKFHWWCWCHILFTVLILFLQVTSDHWSHIDCDLFWCRVVDIKIVYEGRRGLDRMVVGYTTTYAICAYHYYCCDFAGILLRVRCTTLCDKVCQWLATGRWFSLGTPVSSTNKINRHDASDILLKEALNTIKPTNQNKIVYDRSLCTWHIFSGMFEKMYQYILYWNAYTKI